MTAVLSHLLAKSWRDGPLDSRATLAGHLAAASETVSALSDTTLSSQLAAFGLEPDPWDSRARRLLIAAALWHDLGKANDHFVGMLQRTRDARQGLRHETVSLVLALHLKNWLHPAFETDVEWQLFLWAVAGHHRKNWLDSSPAGSGTKLIIHTSHPDFAACLDQIANALEIPGPLPPLSPDLPISLLSSGASRDLRAYHLCAERAFGSLSSDCKKFAALLKSALIAADVTASSLVGSTASSPITSLSRVPSQAELEAIVADRLQGSPPRKFQLEVASARGRVLLVEAGCGTGKTVAAYLRAARHPEFRGRRLFVCYPTTGTATEGFGDYLCTGETKEPHPGASLFHSRAEIDARLILGQPGYDDGETKARADALSLWDTPITVCTVDTILGLLQNQRTGHYLWPCIAMGAFVFDEIHAYDDQLFGTLLRFLRDLPGLPVLLMTASLPVPRLEAIRHVLGRRDESLGIVRGPREIEEIPRYFRSEGEPESAILTLHVSNTVARCIASAQALQDHGITPLVYHSRLKYRDRVQRHAALIRAFKAGGPAYACTTQVCEMSLDLSAELLVTDLAPIPALIQRLGRLNRHDPKQPLPFQILPIKAGREKPYSPEELDLAHRWLAALGAGPISQRDLVTAWEELPAPDLDLSQHVCTWLDGGPLTLPASLREGSHNVTLLMAEDLDEAKAHPERLSELLLPMPGPKDMAAFTSWDRHKFIPVAPANSINYDSLLGARWAE